MQQLFRMRDADGNDYDVPNSDMAEFYGAVPNAANVTRYRDAAGNDYDVPDADRDEFSAAVPNARPLRRVSFANGTDRYFTMPELSKFLRSKEWRESDDYKADREERDRAVAAKMGDDGEMHSPAWAGVKGALAGAAQGAWQGGNAAANRIGKSVLEIGNSLETALGNTVNLFGNAPNALGNWFIADSKGGKEWLDATFPSEAKEWTGYEDWSTKTADKFADVSATAYKFAPAMASGGSTALVNTMFAADGINAAGQTYDNAVKSGFTPAEANAAAAGAFLVNFYGAKAVTKAGGVAADVANPLLRFAGEAAAVGTTMGVQSAANRGIENVTGGRIDEATGLPSHKPRPITEGMGEAFEEGNAEGLIFHAINAVPGAVVKTGDRMRETREMKEYRKDSLLEVARGEGGGELLNTLLPGEGLDAAVRARKNGEDVSRKIGERAGLPDNMSVAERNEIIDAIAKARGERAERNAVKVDGFRADALNEAIKEVVGGEEYADAIRAEVLSNIKNARELDNPIRRAELVEEAAQKVSAQDEQARAAAEHRARSMAGQEERARRKAEMAEYEKQEAERKAREEAEQYAPRIAVSEPPAEKPSAPAETGRQQFPEYYEWLDKTGKKDSDKNWRKFVTENDLDPALAGKRPEPPAEKPAVKPDGKGKMVPVKPKPAEEATKPPVEPPKTAVEEIKKPETAPEPPQKPVETRPVAETGKDTPEPAKPVETPSRAPDAKPVPDGKGRMVKTTKSETKRGPEETTRSAEGGVGRDFEAAKGQAAKEGGQLLVLHPSEEGQSVGFSERHRGLSDGNVPQSPKPVKGVKPDGKGKMMKSAERAPADTTPLSDAIAEAKALEKQNVSKAFEVKVGTTTVKFTSGKHESIARAEKLLKKLQKPTDWTKKPPESSIPKPPSLTVATGKKIGGFDDVSKDFVDKERETLKKPIVQNGKIYATDGRAMIRMDAPGGAKDTKGAYDCEMVFNSRKDKVDTRFTIDLQKAHVALEQARAIKQDDKPTVEMWLSPEGEIMFRSRNNADSPTKPSDAAAFTGKSLHGAQLLNQFDPAYLSKTFKAFAKLGDGKVEAEMRGEMLYLKGKNAEALVMPLRGGEFSNDALSLLMGGKTNRTAAEVEQIIEGNPRLKDALDKNPAGLDPLYSRAPDGDVPDVSAKPKSEKSKLQRIEPVASEPPKSPEQEISERLDLRRLDPRRRSDPKVLAWAKKNGRNVTNGMVTPDAVRAYDEAMTEGTAKKARRWFPDMKIVAHKFGETIKRGVHVIEQRADELEAKWENQRGASSVSEAVAAVKEAGIINKPLENKTLGIKDAVVTSRNLAKMRSEKATKKSASPRLHALAVANVDRLFETAVDEVTHPDTHGRKEISRTHRLGSLLKDPETGKYEPAMLTVLEYVKDGNRIYSIEAVDVGKYEVPTGQLATVAESERYAPIVRTLVDRIAQRAAEVNGGAEKIHLRDTSGGVLGWFDPKSKEVHLLPGADPQTVAHEIMWHGTRQYMTDLAAKGDARAQKFLDMMHDVEQHAPQAIKDMVNRIYARGGRPISRDTLLNEYGAWFTMKKGGAALEKALQTDAGRNWFARGLHTVKEMFKDFLTRRGKNRVDLSAIDGMTRDEFVDFLSDQFASGKTLGSINGRQAPTLSTKETALQRYRRRVYDQNAAVRDLERDIEKKTGKKISADDSLEAANALKYGLKEAANIETQGEMREFRKVLSETGVHYEDLEYYAALKAAAGRDAKIDARNIAQLTADLRAQGASASDIADAIANYRSTNGSHIDPREAKAMLAEIENGPDAAKFKKAYDALRPIIDATLDTQVKAGLVGKAEAAQWRSEEPDYIPFKNEYDAETGEWAGRGMSRNFAKPEHHTAKGRQSAAGDIIAHVFMDHQAAKLRAIENGVRQKLANLVRANPELGKVEALGKNETRNAEKDNPNVVVFKEGGRSYRITLEGTRGEAIANAFTQRNQLNMEWADKKFMGVSLRGFARWTSGMATRYSPTFSVRNTTKDNIELANIVYSERGPIEGSRFMGRYVASRAQMAATLAKYVTTGKIDTTSAGGKVLDRYIKAGGLIAGGTQAEAFDSIKKSLSPEAIAKEMRRGKSKTRAVAKHVLNSIAYLNEYAEMATRVGIFDAEIKAGKSDAEAALFSRRATVDFNRHGDWTPGFNLFRLFSNSTLGATARAAAALSKSKYGAAAAGAMFANGVARSLIDHFANADEDERRRRTGEATGRDISEYERRTSLFYFRSGDRLYKVAEHDSPFSLFSYAGDCVGRWICGDLDGKQVAKNLGVTTAEVAYNFLPMGSINLTAQNGGFADDAKAALISGVLPTALQPVAEVVGNIDYAGRSVYNEPTRGDRTPRAEQGREATPDWAKDAAVKLNEATRGEGSRRGYVDIPPEAIQKLVEGYGKNAMRDVSTAISVGEAIIKGDYSKLDPRNKPVKRDFVRPLDGNDRRFGEAKKKYDDNKDYFKTAAKDMTDEERAAYLDKFPHIRGGRGDELLAAIRKFRKMESGFVYKNGKAAPHEWPQEKLDEFKAKRRALQAQFLELMGE